MSAKRITDALLDATEVARKAGEVAFIIQEAREEDASASRTAYRILGHLGLCQYREIATRPADAPEPALSSPTALEQE